MAVSDQHIINHIRLARSRSVGPVTFHKLVQDYGTTADALDALLDGPNAKKVCTQAQAERELASARKAGMEVCIHGSAEYPYRLASIPDAPPLLYWRGNPTLFQGRLCAIVGARNASGAGLKLTKKMATDLGTAGVTVVSGLARGIDTAAHTASLPTGTIACLAGGADVIYPEENARLYDSIAETGLLISEMPPAVKPLARHFPRRNRIISGLSDGTLIVEAAMRSGSLITARFAADQGRELFAVPGSPLDPRSAGANQLIKDGAVLVRTAEDILAELPKSSDTAAFATKPRATSSARPAAKRESKPALKSHKADLLTLLSPSPIHIDEIVSLSGSKTDAVLAELQLLELDGKVARHAGARFSRIE